MEVNATRRRGRPPRQQLGQSPIETEHLPDCPPLMTITNQRVKRVYFHNGAYLGNFVKLSLDAETNNVDLSLHSLGVAIHFKDTDRFFIAPIGMITGIELYPPTVL